MRDRVRRLLLPTSAGSWYGPYRGLEDNTSVCPHMTDTMSAHHTRPSLDLPTTFPMAAA
jgi:hypothetical protein